MPFISSKESVGLTNNINPFSSTQSGYAVADNVLFLKENEPEQRFGLEKCSNGLPAAVPKQLFTFNDQLVTNINNQLWYEADENCNFSQIQPINLKGFSPRNMVVYRGFTSDPSRVFFVEDRNTIQRLNDVISYDPATNYIRPFAGYSAYGYYAVPMGTLGTGIAMRLAWPCDITSPLSGEDNIYVAEAGSYCIRRIHSGLATSSVVAGVLNVQGSADGALGTNRLNLIAGLCYDNSGTRTIYFVEFTDPMFSYAPFAKTLRFRKLNIATGQVTTISTITETVPYTIGSMWTNSTSNYCYYTTQGTLTLGLDSTTVFASGQTIQRIHKVTGAVTTFCGAWGARGDSFNVPPAATRFNEPGQIWGDDADQNLYVACPNSNRIWRIDVATGNSFDWVGSGTPGILDGIGVAARLTQPRAIGADATTMWVGCADSIKSINMSTRQVTTLGRLQYFGPERTEGYLSGDPLGDVAL